MWPTQTEINNVQFIYSKVLNIVQYLVTLDPKLTEKKVRDHGKTQRP